MDKKRKDFVLAISSAFVIPFVTVLFKAWKKGIDEPATMRDLIVIFGLQTAIVVAILIYVLFFDTAPAVLG